MVITFEIPPTPALAPYVRRYVYREFETHGFPVLKPWFATHEASLHFFFKALPVKLANPVTGEILKTGEPCDMVGMCSQYNGNMHFNGSYSFFQIIFKPDGFTRLFNIPSSYIINQIILGKDIFNADINLLHEQLYEAKNSVEMASLADAFLLSYLKKQKLIHADGISSTVHLIVKKAGFVNIDELARNANMSIRNFERSFQQVTGMSPKLLCCISRFNHALELKLQNLKMDWTTIAHQSGYFDQMHLIKEFKRFAGDTPKALFKDTFLFEEDCTFV